MTFAFEHHDIISQASKHARVAAKADLLTCPAELWLRRGRSQSSDDLQRSEVSRCGPIIFFHRPKPREGCFHGAKSEINKTSQIFFIKESRRCRLQVFGPSSGSSIRHERSGNAHAHT